jgi:hypothetical protein
VVTLRVFLLGRKALFFAPSANFRFALHPRHHNSEAEHENKHRSGSKTTLASAPCSWRQSTVARRVKGCRICRRRNYMTIAPSANFRFALRAQHHNSEAVHESSRRKLIRHFKNSEINFRPLTPTDGRFAYHGCSIETLGSFFL